MTNRKQSLLKLALAVCLSAFLLGCGSKINQENYAKLKNGMTMEEVKAILGKPTQSKTAGIGPLSATTAVWKDSSGTTININFLNGKVQLKSFTKNK